MQLTTKTKIQIVISGIIIIFALAIAGSSFSSLTTPNPKLVQLQKELDDALSGMIDVCMDTKSISDLTNCKQSLQEIKDGCKDSTYSSYSVCDDPRLDQFFINVDDRIAESQSIIDKAKQKVNDKSLDLVNLCYVSKDPACKESMLIIKQQCNEPSLSSLSVCNDPRVDEILARTQPSTTASDVFEYANQQMITFLDVCMMNDDEDSKKDCSEKAKQMISLCANTSVNACNDPRLEEIANWYSNQNIEQPVDTPKLNRGCQPDRLCVKSGDFLKYKADPTVSYVGHDFDGNLTYVFGDFIDTVHLKVNLTFDANDDKHYFQERIMDVSTGLLDPPEQIVDPTVSGSDLPHVFYSISPTLLTYDKLDDVTIEEKIFGGWHGKGDRETIILRNPNPDVTVGIDKETHVIISSFEARYGGGDNSNYVLVDTNVFG